MGFTLHKPNSIDKYNARGFSSSNKHQILKTYFGWSHLKKYMYLYLTLSKYNDLKKKIETFI